MSICAQRQGGFTLIEMVVTVAIVGVLASLALPVSELAYQRTREQELLHALREIRSALDAYKQAADQGRVRKSAEESGYPPNLDLLVEGVEDERSTDKARIHFLRRLPRDPMYPDASVPAADTWGKRSYASPHDDPRPGQDVFDVYSLSSGRAINGTLYREW